MTLDALLNVIVQANALPLHAPLHPVNVAPGCGVAVSLTSVPEA